MKFHLLKFLWSRLNPTVQDELILSSITPGLAKQWLLRKPVHDSMQLLSEAVRSVSGDRQRIYHKPYAVNPKVAKPVHCQPIIVESGWVRDSVAANPAVSGVSE